MVSGRLGAGHPWRTPCPGSRHPTRGRPGPGRARDEGGRCCDWSLDRMEEAVRRRDHPSHAIHRGNRVSVNGSAVCPRTAVRVVVVDDHAAIRMGLRAAIDSRPPLVSVGVAADGEQLAPLLYRTRPDVVILDYDLPRANGLDLCRRVKVDVPAPAVLLYSAYADAVLALAAPSRGSTGSSTRARRRGGSWRRSRRAPPAGPTPPPPPPRPFGGGGGRAPPAPRPR